MLVTIEIILMLLYIHQLTAQTSCSTKTCRCQSSTKGVKFTDRDADLAFCTALPNVPFPNSIISVQIRTDALNLTHQTLYPVQNVSLLDISGCNLSVIEENVFVTMNNLTVLRLSNNKLSTLPQHVFVTLQFLKELYLDNNELVTITDEFRYLTKLEILSLSHNKLVNFPDNLPGSLIYLNISYNLIKPTIPPNLSYTEMGIPLFRGETLDLYGNQVEHILSWSWMNMTNLKVLRLGNKVTTISHNITEDSINLKEFTLSARECPEAALLDGVTQIMLKKMPKLSSLTLEHYAVDNLKFLQPMTELKKLVFSYIHTRGNLLSINEGFAQLTKLQHLDLEGSARLTGLILDNMKDLPIDESLTFLGLKNTELKELHLYQMPGSFSIKSDFQLDLRDNLLQCDISLCWIYELPVREINLVSPEYTYCEEYSRKGQTQIHLLETKHEVHCLETQFGITTPMIKIYMMTTSNPSGHNAPPKAKINNFDIIIITIIILLAILVICLMIVYMYLRTLKVHIFLPMNDPNPPIRLQEIDHSQEDITQEPIIKG